MSHANLKRSGVGGLFWAFIYRRNNRKSDVFLYEISLYVVLRQIKISEGSVIKYTRKDDNGVALIGDVNDTRGRFALI